MVYYILYPKDDSKPVKIQTNRPDPRKSKKIYGFAEGPFKTQKEVRNRLNWMNIPMSKRPEKYRKI